VLLALVTGALALVATQQTDTSVTVGRGQRLEVNAYGGGITVSAWNRNAVRVEANTSGPDRVEISSTATTVSVRTQGRHGPPSEIELKISAPPWMALSLAGVHTNVIRMLMPLNTPDEQVEEGLSILEYALEAVSPATVVQAGVEE